MKWQEYGKRLKKELKHLRNRDKQWKEGLTKAVDELKTEREKYSNLEKLYSIPNTGFQDCCISPSLKEKKTKR